MKRRAAFFQGWNTGWWNHGGLKGYKKTSGLATWYVAKKRVGKRRKWITYKMTAAVMTLGRVFRSRRAAIAFCEEQMLMPEEELARLWRERR